MIISKHQTFMARACDQKFLIKGSKTMTIKVIPIKKESGAKVFALEIANNIEKISDLIVMVRYKDLTSEHMWFGEESSMRCLGMATYMVGNITNYIQKENDI